MKALRQELAAGAETAEHLRMFREQSIAGILILRDSVFTFVNEG